jgi:hypothetical protein
MKKNRLFRVFAVVGFAALGAAIVAFTVGNASVSAHEAERKREVAKWERGIQTLNPATLKSSYPGVQDYPDEFLDAYSLGYASAPYLLDSIDDSSENGFTEALLISAATNNLHLYAMIGANTTQEYTMDSDAYTPKWYAERLREFAGSVPAKVEEICNSESSIEDQYESLDRLGILAIPYLIDRIHQGEEQWEWSVYAQLLDYSIPERFRILSQTELNSYSDKAVFIRASVPISEIVSENEEDFILLKQFCSYPNGFQD